MLSRCQGHFADADRRHAWRPCWWQYPYWQGAKWPGKGVKWKVLVARTRMGRLVDGGRRSEVDRSVDTSVVDFVTRVEGSNKAIKES
jgi:hypothetical protein